MEHTIFIIRYVNPALSYLPKIGTILHETMKNYHNHLILYSDIDKFIAGLEVRQESILRHNPRLKPIKINRHDGDNVIRIDTPVNNQDPEELFLIEPVVGYIGELSPKLEIKAETVLEKMLQQRLDVLRYRKMLMDCDVARSGEYDCSIDPEQHNIVIAQIKGLEDFQKIVNGEYKITY